MTGIFADKICRYHHDIWKPMRFSKCKENIRMGDYEVSENSWRKRFESNDLYAVDGC